MLIIGDFLPNYSDFSKDWKWFGESARPIVFFLRERVGDKGKILGKSFEIFLVCTQKAHNLWNSQKIANWLFKNG